MTDPQFTAIAMSVAATLIMFIGGCSSTPTNVKRFETPIDAIDDFNSVGRISAEEIFGAATGEKTIEKVFLITQGKHAGETTLTKRTRNESRWQREDRGVRTIEGALDDEGIVVVSETDLAANVAITYDPPLRIFPARMSAGRTYQAESRMVVTNLKTGAPKEKGSCHITMRLLGRAPLQTPAGEIDAVFVEVNRKLDLQLANVDVRIITAYREGEGIVAEHIRRTTRAIGIFGSTRIDEKRLAQ